MSKPKILHFINNLGRGGAENFLVQLLEELIDFDNYIVTLGPENEFGPNINAKEIINLNAYSYRKYPIAISKFYKVVKKIQPDIVHSQLTLANSIARFGVPARIPLITSIQNSIKYNIEFKKWYIRVIEKLSLLYNPGHIIFVSESVKKDYVEFLNVKRHLKSSVIYNFVNTDKFNKKNPELSINSVKKIVSVGSLSYQKNFHFLISGFLNANLPDTILHIYGEGPLKVELETLIKNSDNKVKLKGKVTDLHVLLNEYDLYVASSIYEGLSLSVLEAMASGIPILLSDIPSFREQCGDTAFYFKINDESDFKRKLSLALSQESDRKLYAENAYKRVNQLFSMKEQVEKIKELYRRLLT